MIKVGSVKEYVHKKDNKTKKMKKVEILFTYKDVKFDIDGWADSKEFLPEDYDLVYMKSEGRKTIPGWACGSSWNGLRYKKEDEVKYWKRKPDETN
ncbi:MAG: hypothetical protein AAB875_06800 [Patescibacteria group bacterium]